MNGAAQIAVATLKVRAARREHVQAFANDIEDALRTAMLGRSGAVLLVKTLDLGRVPAGLPRQALSRLVEKRLQGLAAMPLENQLRDSAAQTVLAPDIAQAACLALQAIDAGRAGHWALAKLFPGTQSGSIADRSRSAISGLLQRGGIDAVARLAGRPRDAALLSGALGRFGEAELGALLALVLEQAGPPAGAPAPIRQDGRTRRAAGTFEPAAQSASENEAAALPVFRPGGSNQAPFAPSPAVIARRALLIAAMAARGRGGVFAARLAVQRLLADAALPEPGDGPDRTEARQAMKQPKRADQMLSGPEVSAARTQQSPPEPAGATPGAQTQDKPEAGDGWEFAGLWLLIAAIRRAGAEEAETAVELPLFRAVLDRFAARLGKSARQRLVSAIGEPWELPLDSALPAWCSWRVAREAAGMAGNRLRLCRSSPGRAIVSLRRGLPLAQIDASGLHGIRGLPVKRLTGSETGATINDLVNGLCLAAQRIVFSLTGSGWRALARRRGLVRVTPTHADITFDARDLDIRIRLAGLDFDPGWTPWLGRIVSFHYDHSNIRCHGPDRKAGSA